MKLRPFAVAITLFLAISTTGCFGLFGGGEPEDRATIVVLNDMVPSEPMTIEIRKAGDDASTLGTVEGGAERSLDYESEDLQGAYQLIARKSSGAAVISREFTLFANALVRWQMGSNTVSVTQGQAR